MLTAVVTRKKEDNRLMSVKNEKVKGPLCPHVERLTSPAAGGQAAEKQTRLGCTSDRGGSNCTGSLSSGRSSSGCTSVPGLPMDAGAELSVFHRPSGSQLIAGGKLIILARPPQKETETDAGWGQIYLPCLQCLDPRNHRISTLPTWEST